ncbi:MAG: PD40 domain-containing protein, partial [Anaerolineales bacterium]|nr:PD40 domain-containing protein [Anaerolineales bacterium]
TIISSEMTPPHFAETPTPTFTPLPILTPEDAQALVFEGKIAVLTLEQQQPPFNPQGQLQIVDFATQDVLLLSEDVSSYEWAPNGQRLAYSAFSRISGTYELYTVNSDGTELIKLDPPLVGKVDRLSPTWSPDSKQIAFTQPEAGEHLIHIMNADGSNVQFLTKGMWPAWSPDGSMIAFLKSRNGRAAGDIFIIDLATRGLRQLTEDIDAGQPVWSPDGRFIAFYGNQQTNNQSGLFVAQVDGTTAIRIVPEIDWFPVWAPGWSPDSSQVIFAQDGTLYVVQVNSLNILPLELPLGPFYLSGTLSP